MDKQDSSSSLLSGSTIYNLLTLATSSERVSAAVDKASQYLPSSISKLATTSSSSLIARKSSSTTTTNLPPIILTINTKTGQEIYVPIPQSTTLYELRDICAHQHASIPASLQRLVIEEDRLPTSTNNGIVAAIKSTASQLSREKIRETIVDWVNFIFLPEAVNREVRGRGIVRWFTEHVLPHVQDPPPPHITLTSVVLLNGRRPQIELSSTATVARLFQAVEKQTGLPVDRQRLIMQDAGAHNIVMKLFWSIVKVVFTVVCACVAVGMAWSKWIVVGGSDNDQLITLNVQVQQGVDNNTATINNNTSSSSDNKNSSSNSWGSFTRYRSNNSSNTTMNTTNTNTNTTTKVVSVKVRPDVTLGELQHQLQLQHGDGVNLQGLVLNNNSSNNGVDSDSTTMMAY